MDFPVTVAQAAPERQRLKMLFVAIFWVAVGIIIGWNWPQPPWAREAQDKLVGFVKGVIGK